MGSDSIASAGGVPPQHCEAPSWLVLAGEDDAAEEAAEAGEAPEGDESPEAGVAPRPDPIGEAIAHCHVDRKTGVVTCSLPPWNTLQKLGRITTWPRSQQISRHGTSAAYAICIRAVSRRPRWLAIAGGTHFCGGCSPGSLSARLLHGRKGSYGATSISLASFLSTISHHLHPHPVRSFCVPPRKSRV